MFGDKAKLNPVDHLLGTDYVLTDRDLPVDGSWKFPDAQPAR
jgi:hypothetical protein